VTALSLEPGTSAGSTLDPGAVHVSFIELDAVRCADDLLAAHLSSDELARAAGFRLALHRRRFLVAHAFLRSVLGDCLGRPPAALQFARGVHGKPLLTGLGGLVPHFSLSHSGSMAACAVADEPVGVDLECAQPISEETAIATRIFSPRRQAEWAAEPALRRAATLLVGWTQFEALAKAQGGGLVAPPRPIDLDAEMNRWQPVADRGRWSVIALEPATGSVMSVAVAGTPARLSVARAAWHEAGESATLRES
jgi:4'-phosphopantetheinyl transferase